MNKTQTEIVTICFSISAGFFVSRMLSTSTYPVRALGIPAVPTEMAAVGPAAPLVQFSNDMVQLPEPPAKVWYKDAGVPTETGLEWMFPKAPPLHLLDLRHRQ